MLKLFNANKKNFSKKLELILNLRKLKQQNQSSAIKKILSEVIDVTLDDQGDAWDTKNMPKHKVL